jgi:hypothetical protein
MARDAAFLCYNWMDRQVLLSGNQRQIGPEGIGQDGGSRGTGVPAFLLQLGNVCQSFTLTRRDSHGILHRDFLPDCRRILPCDTMKLCAVRGDDARSFHRKALGGR